MNERDLKILSQADAREVMEKGYEAAVQTLEDMGTRELTDREKAMGAQLEVFCREHRRQQTLEELGVSREVYGSEAFRSFSGKFRDDVPVEEVYSLYAASHPGQSLKSLGSLRSRQEGKAVKDFYSFQEAKAFTRQQLDADPALFRAVMASMPKWGK